MPKFPKKKAPIWKKILNKLFNQTRDSRDNELCGFKVFFKKIADLPPNICQISDEKSDRKGDKIQSQ